VTNLPVTGGGGIPSPAPFIDHTLLKPETTATQIERICEEAVEWGFAAVCVPPCYVPRCAALLYGSAVSIATVVGFPLGYSISETKAFETARAIEQGAGEIDMVIAIGKALSGDWKGVAADIREVVRAAQGRPVKAILECSALDPSSLQHAAKEALDAGVSYLKTSTGFGAHGARVEDVQLLRCLAQGRASVKASGGIRDLAQCRAMLEAGASRIGTSSGVAIMRAWQEGLHA